MRVYKFLNAEFGMRAVRDRRLKITTLPDLNDPFDLSPFDLTNPEVREAIQRTTLTVMCGREPAKGMLCFSGNWHNPVLWAHYADKHRGMCLGFDFPDGLGRAVDYLTTRHQFYRPEQPVDGATLEEHERYLQDANRLADRLLYAKFDGWRYEDEVRAWLNIDEEIGGLYFIAFSPVLELTDVIAGMQCPWTTADIATALIGYRKQVRVTRAMVAHDTFAMTEDTRHHWTKPAPPDQTDVG